MFAIPPIISLREPAVGWFGLSLAPLSKYIARFARQYRYSTRVSPDAVLLKLSSPSVKSRQDEKTTHNTRTHMFTTHEQPYTHISIHFHTHFLYTHM